MAEPSAHQRAGRACVKGRGLPDGLTSGPAHKNVELRRRQFAVAGDPARCLDVARRFVQAKIANCRTVLRRNHQAAPDTVLRDLKADQRHAGEAGSLRLFFQIISVLAIV